MADEVKAAREVLVERIVEADDELMMRYLDGEQISGEELSGALRVAVARRNLFPALPGSSATNVGIIQLLDALADVMPSPLEMPPRDALKNGDTIKIVPNPAGAFSALCFKVMVDPYVGKLSFMRVFSGSLTSDQTLFNVNKGEEERISAFKFMKGKEGEDQKEVVCGDIVVIPKLHSTTVGDTLSIKGTTFQYPPIKFPRPIYSVAVTPKSRADEDKLSNAIHRMREEDATLHFEKTRKPATMSFPGWEMSISTSSFPR
jgi:Translation elongation factors (GTPases)